MPLSGDINIDDVENLKEKTAKGLFWGFVNNSSSQLLNLALGIFLARSLVPADYGIVGVLAIFTAVAVIFQNSGFLQGLVNLKEPQDNDYNAVFWFNLGVSFVFYVLLFLGAPLIADFFHQPCLVVVSRVLFLVLPIYAFGMSYAAYMIKNMMNREIAVIGIISMAVAGTVAVVMARCGFSYWSLVANQILYALVYNIGRCYIVRWHPSFKIDFGPVRRMLGFSSKLLVTQLFVVLNQQLLTFVLGRFFSINSVGFYTQANKWSSMARATISGAVGQVAQPVFVSISDEREREIMVLRKLVRFTAFFCFPAMFGLALVANEFILLLLGAKWAGSVLLLQILCIGGAFIPLYEVYQNFLMSNGRSDVYMWGNIAQMVILLVTILLIYRQGIVAVVCASSVCSVCWLFIWQFICCRFIGGRFLDFVKDVVPFMLLSLLAMGVVYILTMGVSNLWLALLLRIVMAASLYFVIMKFAQAKILEECINFVRRKRKA